MAQTIDGVLQFLLWVMAQVLPEFGQFGSADYVAYGFNISGDWVAEHGLDRVGILRGVVRGRILLPEDARGGKMSRASFLHPQDRLSGGHRAACCRCCSGWASLPPAAPRASRGSPGGRLAQLRTAEDLDQAQLGKIDPTSETIKLATLGLRGIAANILWTKANNYKMKKDWTNLSATLNQIIKLQPNFVDVWQFQAWNLSYNCSAEFDDYRERYHWVIKGIDFLKEGISYNEFEPRLVRDVGRFISQKIGRADEHVQFRRLFREDDDFNASIPKDNRDNWYVGKQWYLKAEKLVDTHDDVRSVGTSPLLFRSEAPMCQMNYADALEKDGVFGEKAKTEWKRAGKEWEDYGKLDIPTSEGRTIRLGELDRLDDQLNRLNGQLDKLVPGAREKLLNNKAAMLTDAQREAIATPLRARTAEQHQLAAEADELTRVTPDEVARQATGANRAKANQLLETIHDQMETIRLTKSYQGIVNYDYWGLRADVEQTDGMLDARKLVFEADKAYAEGNLPVAHDKYERGAVAWAGVLARFPELMSDQSTIDDIDDLVKTLRKGARPARRTVPRELRLGRFRQLPGPRQ